MRQFTIVVAVPDDLEFFFAEDEVYDVPEILSNILISELDWKGVPDFEVISVEETTED